MVGVRERQMEREKRFRELEKERTDKGTEGCSIRKRDGKLEL